MNWSFSIFLPPQDDFKLLREAYKKGQRITEAFIDNSTQKAIGRDLGTYDCTLTSKDGVEYSLW